MSRTPPAPIVSGRGYRITGVAGHPVHDLSELLGPVTEFTIDDPSGYVVRGTARWDGTTVKFYEKDGGTGRDLRRWRLTQNGPDFTAVHIVG